MVAELHRAADEIVDARPGALAGHVDDLLGIGQVLEQLAGEMRHGAGAGRAVGNLVLIGLGVGDELLEVLRRHARVHDDAAGRYCEDGNRIEVLGRRCRGSSA